MQRRRPTALMLISVLLAACTASGQSVPPNATPSDAKPTSTQAREATPKPCTPGFVCSGLLAPGEYTSTSLGPTLTFTIGEGTTGGEDTPNSGFGLSFAAVGRHGAMTITQFPGTIFSDECSYKTTQTIGTSPAEFIGFLSAVKGITAEAPVNVTIGGRPAIRLDLSTKSPCINPDRMWLWLTGGLGDFHFNDAELARVYAIDGGGVTIVVVSEAFPLQHADYEALLTASEAVLASMTITPGS